jgi:hypothetical protein
VRFEQSTQWSKLAAVQILDTEPADEEEEIIDLMNVAEPQDAGMGAPEPVSSVADAETDPVDEAEDVIDLVDVASTAETEPAPTDVPDEAPIIEQMDTAQPLTAEAEASGNVDDIFSDLESRAEAMLATPGAVLETPEEAAETAGPGAEIELFKETDIEAEPGDSEPEEIAEAPVDQPASADGSMDTATFIPVTPPKDQAVLETEQVTDEQIHAALTEVIEKVYAERIEQLMLQTIEKTVKREIEKIKHALLEDDDI